MLAHFVRDIFGSVGPLQDVVEALQAGAMRRAPDFLLDHMPRGYASTSGTITTRTDRVSRIRARVGGSAPLPFARTGDST